jgi:hypothetical protein
VVSVKPWLKAWYERKGSEQVWHGPAVDVWLMMMDYPQVQGGGKRGVANTRRAVSPRVLFSCDETCDILKRPTTKGNMSNQSSCFDHPHDSPEADVGHSGLIANPAMRYVDARPQKARPALPYIGFAAVAGLLFGYDMCIIGCE